jgi:hypothetical protein
MVWQLSFTDDEVAKLLDRRQAQLLARREAVASWQGFGSNFIEGPSSITQQYHDAARDLRTEERKEL